MQADEGEKRKSDAQQKLPISAAKSKSTQKKKSGPKEEVCKIKPVVYPEDHIFPTPDEFQWDPKASLQVYILKTYAHSVQGCCHMAFFGFLG